MQELHSAQSRVGRMGQRRIGMLITSTKAQEMLCDLIEVPGMVQLVQLSHSIRICSDPLSFASQSRLQPPPTRGLSHIRAEIR